MTRGLRLAPILWLAPALAWPDGIAIAHKAVGCVEAGKFPRFEARFDPDARVAKARVCLRSTGGSQWYSVPMKKQGASYSGVLPKPEKELTGFDYYISVLDASFGESRTAEYAPSVVSGAACGPGKVTSVGLVKAAQVLVTSPEGAEGAPLVPAGFSSQGVVAVAPAGATSGAATGVTAGAGGAMGATAGAAAAAGATGGGLSLTTIGLVGAAVTGGVVAATKLHGDNGGGGVDTYTGSFDGIFPFGGGDCIDPEHHTGTVHLGLHNAGGDLAGSTADVEETIVVVGDHSSTCLYFRAPGATWTNGIPPTPVTGSLGHLEFTYLEDIGQFGVTTWTFSGSGTSATINGVLTESTKHPTLGDRGSMTVPVTLTRQR